MSTGVAEAAVAVSAEQIAVIDYASADRAVQLAAAFRQHGFAVLNRHPLAEDLIARVYTAWQRFFADPVRHDYAFEQSTHAGYVSTQQAETAKGSQVKDIKEFYHFYPWAPCPPELQAVTMPLYQALEQLACTLLADLEQCLPAELKARLDRPLADMVRDCKRSLLRPIHYPPLTGQEEPGAVRAAAHEDICMLTLIPRATSAGLQVLSKQHQWLPVPCNPDYIVVNVGDCLQECTEGFYPSTTHRVINPENPQQRSTSRISMPLFLHAHDDVVLSERHTADSYRQLRFRELGLLDD